MTMLLMALSALLAATPESMGIIGKIGTKTYKHSDYDKLLNNYFNYWQNQGQKVTDQKKKELNNQLWEEEIARYLYDTEIQKRKLEPTEKDLYNKALQSPPTGVTKIADLQTNGKFDKDKYKQALDNVPQFKKQVIDDIRPQYRYEKLFANIKAEVRVDADSIYREWYKANNKASGKIIHFYQPKNGALPVTEEEMVAFYQNNPELFKRPPHRRFKFIKFQEIPSAQDTLYADNRADSLYQILKNGADFAEIAKKYSQDTGSSSKGGDLGYFAKGRMTPSYEKACWETPVGEIAQPFKSSGGWHIIKVFDKRKTLEGVDEVKASQIIIRYTAGPETLEQLRLFIERVHQETKEFGIENIAEKYNLRVLETEAIRENDKYTPVLGPMTDLFKYAFENPVGSVPDIVSGRNNEKFVLQVSESMGDHYAAYDEEKELVKRFVQREKSVASQITYANLFLKTYTPDNYFKMAEADSLTIVDFEDITADSRFTRIGDVPALRSAILGLNKGQFSELIIDDNGVYLAQVTQKINVDNKAWQKVKNSEIKKVRETLENNHINQWYINQRQRLKIEDYRKSFYKL